MREAAFKTFFLALLLGVSLSTQAQASPDANRGLITLNGRALLPADFYTAINDGYPNSVNDDVSGPAIDCAATTSEQSDDEPDQPRRQGRSLAQSDDDDDDDTTIGLSSSPLVQPIPIDDASDDLPTDLDDLDEYFTNITSEPDPNCGYSMRINQANVDKFCDALNDVANGREIRESASCHVSNCSTASAIAIVKILRDKPDWPQKKSLFECNSPWPPGYSQYIETEGLKKLVINNDLGEFKVVTATALGDEVAQGWPSKSDPILLNRKRGTGHAAIFDHYKTVDGSVYDPANPKPIDRVCYWTSNGSTRGPGKNCERLASLNSIHMAKIR